MRRDQGFTLLELVVTLSVVAVLLLMAGPSFREYVLNQELRAAAARLASDFRWARQSAVDRGGRVVVCPGSVSSGCRATPEWGSGWIVFHDHNGDRRLAPDEELLRETPALEGVSARSNLARRQLSFFPNGTAPGSNLTIRLCDVRGPNHARQVRVGLSGRIRSLRVGEGADPGC
ncbi:MAG: GspH/FimT family pseudopilin [Xanthomonadales bacterium]|jgi:type IV fimbrial biogenesis protein FimT|nr:GspH/FimT family pseudopilin [Xanthomonadales bacterium]